MAAHFNIGRDMYGFGYGGTGMKSYNDEFESYGSSFGVNNVVGCFLSWDRKEISYSVNGSHKGLAYKIPPHSNIIGMPLFPAITLKNCEVIVNFGQSPFQYSPHIGNMTFLGISSARPEDVLTYRDKDAYINRNDVNRKPLAIIIEPSRELAQQVHDNIVQFLKYVNQPELFVSLYVGGNQQQSKKLKEDSISNPNNHCDIIVGTLGKLASMLQNKQLDLRLVRFFVLDEADHMTEADNISQIMQLYDACPVSGIGDNRLQVRYLLLKCIDITVID
jgi:ATP-dependent RNA helicase DDX1